MPSPLGSLRLARSLQLPPSSATSSEAYLEQWSQRLGSSCLICLYRPDSSSCSTSPPVRLDRHAVGWGQCRCACTDDRGAGSTGATCAHGRAHLGCGACVFCHLNALQAQFGLAYSGRSGPRSAPLLVVDRIMYAPLDLRSGENMVQFVLKSKISS